MKAFHHPRTTEGIAGVRSERNGSMENVKTESRLDHKEKPQFGNGERVENEYDEQNKKPTWRLPLESGEEVANENGVHEKCDRIRNRTHNRRRCAAKMEKHIENKQWNLCRKINSEPPSEANWDERRGLFDRGDDGFVRFGHELVVAPVRRGSEARVKSDGITELTEFCEGRQDRISG